MLLWLPSTRAQGWFRPGDAVPESYLKVFGSKAFFSVVAIPDRIQERMDGCSYKALGGIRWDDLRYLRVLHRDKDGNAIVGEMVCHKSVANNLLLVFKELYENHYPIERMLLVEHYGGDDEASMRDNNTSCFNQRQITSGGMLSRHSYGLAVDINPRYNPYFRMKNGKAIIKPEESTEYLDRSAVSPYMIRKGDLCYRLFKQHGFRWGGDWIGRKDYQHFQK